MKKLPKHLTLLLIAILTTTTLLTALSLFAYAQDETPPPPIQIPTPPSFPPPEGKAVVIIIATLGGTTDPVPGTYTYDNGTVATAKAIPWIGFTFSHWLISGEYTPGHNLPPTIAAVPSPDLPDTPAFPNLPSTSLASQYDSLIQSQNPLIVSHGYGYTYQYQAVFVPDEHSGTGTEATLVVKSAVGGTTTPAAGTYSYLQDSLVNLQATPDSGFEFKEWIISGEVMPGHGNAEWDNNVVTDNPYQTHTPYGYTYTYQPVFTPVGSSTGSTGVSMDLFYIIVAVLVIIIVIVVVVAAYALRKPKK